MILTLVLKVLQRLARFPYDLFFPVDELLPEIFPLAFIHEWLGFRRPVVREHRASHEKSLLAASSGAEYSDRPQGPQQQRDDISFMNPDASG
jgi:hypothetical protein